MLLVINILEIQLVLLQAVRLEVMVTDLLVRIIDQVAAVVVAVSCQG